MHRLALAVVRPRQRNTTHQVRAQRGLKRRVRDGLARAGASASGEVVEGLVCVLRVAREYCVLRVACCMVYAYCVSRVRASEKYGSRLFEFEEFEVKASEQDQSHLPISIKALTLTPSLP
jgi:hypothetical protein